MVGSGTPAAAVRRNCTGGKPSTVAVTTTGPGAGPSVTPTPAEPFASVVVRVDVSVADPEVTAYATVIPSTGTPARKVNCTASGSGSVDPTVPVCESPPEIA